MIIDYCYWKSPLNFWLNSTQSGRVVAILDFHYDRHIAYLLLSSTFARWPLPIAYRRMKMSVKISCIFWIC